MASKSRLDEWEASLYFLGEKLHMPVYKIKDEMPLSELIGWLNHFKRSSKPKQQTPEEVLMAFGCLPLK
jgi:hypothetical protein